VTLDAISVDSQATSRATAATTRELVAIAWLRARASAIGSRGQADIARQAGRVRRAGRVRAAIAARGTDATAVARRREMIADDVPAVTPVQEVTETM
jgi:hypothetical protein